MRAPRRLSILDAMILVGALAVGLAAARAIGRGHLDFPRTLRQFLFGGTPSCLVISAAAALLAIRLRAPRPRLARLSRQPGFVACAATVAAFALGISWTLAEAGVQGGFSWYQAVESIPAFVLGAWLALWWSRRFRAEAGAVDRLGRVVGFYWVVGFAYFVLQPAIDHLYWSVLKG